MKIFLTDNGSLRPAAIFSLRRLAGWLSEALGHEVLPASLLHTNRVNPELIDGQPAEILEMHIRHALAEGVQDIGVIPLFFGPSRALTEYIPAVESRLRKTYSALRLRVARPLVDTSDPATVEALGALLMDLIQPVLPATTGGDKPGVILVDHGTPEIAVNRVRNAMGRYLADRLGQRVSTVISASMERRPEPEYEFNNPLLETALLDGRLGEQPTVVTPLFLQPGRHAGPGGDLESICRETLGDEGFNRLKFTPLVGEHPGTVDILAARGREILARAGCRTR